MKEGSGGAPAPTTACSPRFSPVLEAAFVLTGAIITSVSTTIPRLYLKLLT